MYNVTQYIERCLESVFIQDYPSEKYEVILINDGSSDNSEEIAHNYCVGRSNVKIISQENKGLGGARNSGIDNASNDYLIFLDSDDLLEQDSLMQVSTKYGQVLFDVIELAANNVSPTFSLLTSFKPSELTDFKSGIDYYLTEKNIPSVCNKIYNRDFLNSYKLRFKEKMYIEDFEFNTRAFFYAKKVLCTGNISLEKFVQTEGSITRNKNKSVKQKLVHDLFHVATSVKLFSATVSSNKLDVDYFNDRMSRINVNIVFQAYKYGFSREEINNLISELKSQNLYYLDKKIKLKNKEVFRKLVYNFKFLFDILIYFKNER
jgi:glycosyltransferase involved in cell wall biosynthesis